MCERKVALLPLKIATDGKNICALIGGHRLLVARPCVTTAHSLYPVSQLLSFPQPYLVQQTPTHEWLIRAPLRVDAGLLSLPFRPILALAVLYCSLKSSIP